MRTESSTVAVAPALSRSGTAELHSTPLRPGTAARRLQAEDNRDELFRNLPESYSLSHRLRRHGLSTLRYLMQTEVHTYAFSVAANCILSFFPFIVLLLTVVRRVFHSPEMYNVVLQLLRNYLPSNKDFVIRNLQFLASVRGRGQVLSFLMLLITSTGVFLPLEVALNSVWGFKKNRSYLMNLSVSLGLALACGCLAVLSIALTAHNLRVLGRVLGDGFTFEALGSLLMKAVGDRRDHLHLLPDLLGAAAWKSAGARRAAGGHRHRPGLGSREVRVHSGPSLAEFSGSIRAILGFGDAYLLVVLERHAAAGRGVSFRRRTWRPGAGAAGDGRKRVDLRHIRMDAPPTSAPVLRSRRGR